MPLPSAVGLPLELVKDAKESSVGAEEEDEASLMCRLAVSNAARFVIHVLIHAKQKVRTCTRGAAVPAGVEA